VDKEELENFRHECRFFALESLFTWQLQILQIALLKLSNSERASFVRSVKSKPSHLRAHIQTPEMQEAFDDLFRSVERALDQVI
jgi:transcription termination factor NusB